VRKVIAVAKIVVVRLPVDLSPASAPHRGCSVAHGGSGLLAAPTLEVFLEC
jgi:hypothetical protein